MTITARLGGRTLLAEGTYVIPSTEILSVSVSLTPKKFPELELQYAQPWEPLPKEKTIYNIHVE